MNNKKFLLTSIILLGGLFVFFRFIANNPKNSKNGDIPKISSEILIKSHSFIYGETTAPVTLVEFLDPECEACRAMHPIIKELLKEYEGKVRLVVRYMPLHKNSMFAATALEEAREQGKFNEALNVLFENQPAWGNHHNPRPDLIPTYLESLGIPKDSLNPEKLLAKHGAKIEIDRNDGQAAGVRSTPTFFVNGVRLNKIGYEPVKQAIDQALEELK